MRGRVGHLAVALMIVLPDIAGASEPCRAAYAQWDLEDLLVIAFEALPQPEVAGSSHCAFHLDLAGMDLPDTGAELGRCRWQGTDGETMFFMGPDQPDRVSVIRNAETLATVDLCEGQRGGGRVMQNVLDKS